MTHGIDLSRLSHAEKDHLILSLFGRVDAALARIADLEKRLAVLEQPPKNPDNLAAALEGVTRRSVQN